MDQYPIDQTDLRILQTFQELTSKPPTRAELSKQEIDSPTRPGHKLSDATIGEHVKRLEEERIIKGYIVDLDAEKLGLGYMGFVHIHLEKLGNTRGFREGLQAISGVIEAYSVTGGADCIARVLAVNRRSFYDVLNQIRALPSVAHFETYIVLDEMKSPTTIPLDHLHDAPLILHHRNSSTKTMPANTNLPDVSPVE